MNDISRLVKQFLRQNKISQVEIAKEIGVSTQNLSKLLREKESFDINDANRILKAVGCHVEVKYNIVPDQKDNKNIRT